MNGLIRWSPILDSFEDMDKFFSDYAPASRRRGLQGGYVPAIDMYEDKDNVMIEAQLAGVDPDKVEISIEKDVLTLKGESEKKTEVQDKNYYRQEIQRGGFYRSIMLPARVEGEKASAVSSDGVLKITIPKAPEAKPKMIKIETKNKS
jgi:HSP20 family protein